MKHNINGSPNKLPPPPAPLGSYGCVSWVLWSNLPPYNATWGPRFNSSRSINMSRYTNTSRSIKDITASWPNTLCYLHLPLFSGIFATPLKIMHHVTLLNNTPMATDWSPYNLTRPRSEHRLIAYIACIIRYIHVYVVYSFVLILLPLLFDSG